MMFRVRVTLTLILCTRQVGALRSGRGGEVVQETRLFDEGRGVTYSMRRKEGLADYRYFPEPDLLPLHVSDAYLDDLRVRTFPLQCPLVHYSSDVSF